MLYTMTQRQLAHTKFLWAIATRRRSASWRSSSVSCNARKHDSQDICFVPDSAITSSSWSSTRAKALSGRRFLDLDGKPVGKHKGAVHYKVGQRRGLGPCDGREPVHVCGRIWRKNTVSVGPGRQRCSRSPVIVDDMNWISIPELTEPIHIKARFATAMEQPVTGFSDGERPCQAGV